MTSAHVLLLLLAFLGVYNCGVIWPTQQVTYPLFHHVDADQFVPYHASYNRRITFVVILPGFLFFLTPLALLVVRPPAVPLWAAVLSVMLGISALLVTVLREIPRHIRLQRQGKSEQVIQELITFNWLRTGAITLNTVVVVWMLTRAFAAVAA